MSEVVELFDFIELGQAIMKAREQQRITREELAEELGILARHLQSIEKEGQYPSFQLFIQLVTMFQARTSGQAGSSIVFPALRQSSIGCCGLQTPAAHRAGA